MTTANEFFGSEDNQNEDPNTQVDNPLEVLVGEGRKFRSVEDLARGKIESDNHIKRIQEENRLLREEMNSRARLEELVEKLSKPTTPSNEHNQSHREPETSNAPSNITKDELEKFYKEQRRKESEEKNLNDVVTELTKTFGSNWKSKVQEKARSLGLSDEDAFNLAKSKPKVLLELLGNQRTAERNPVAPASSVNLPNALNGVKDWAYYEKLRVENPKLYYSGPVQKEVLKAWTVHSQA